MDYTLAVLTHGSSDTLAESLASFDEMISPAPADRILHHDTESHGFCRATSALWEKALQVGNEYVFWLEHDFVFMRPLDLRELATVLDATDRLSQIALMRDAVNAIEKKAGGLFESRNGPERWERYEWGYAQGDYVMTTNPSLMKFAFMSANPWPDYESECEGKFGIDLHERGFVGGVWGDGSPWVKHIGVRTGHSY